VYVMLQRCKFIVPACHRRMRDQMVQLIACAVQNTAHAPALCDLLDEALTHVTFVCVPALRAYINWLHGTNMRTAWCRVFDAVLENDVPAAALWLEHLDNSVMWATFQDVRKQKLTVKLGEYALCTYALTEPRQLDRVFAQQNMLSDVYIAAVYLQQQALGTPLGAIQPPLGCLTRCVMGMDAGAQDEPCNVCWETMRADERTDNLRCGHLFHVKCLTQWFSSYPARTCPTCRHPHTGELRNSIVTARQRLGLGMLHVAAFESGSLWATF